MTKLLPIQRFTVHGNSMLPTLKPGQDVLTRNWFIKLKVGDIVVIHHANRDIIKRIQQISDQGLFVVGDNLNQSTDSRHFGWINRKQVLGKVLTLNK